MVGDILPLCAGHRQGGAGDGGCLMWNNDANRFAFMASIIWQGATPLFESGHSARNNFFLNTISPSIKAVCRAIDFDVYMEGA